jgi:hypothetical protein
VDWLSQDEARSPSSTELDWKLPHANATGMCERNTNGCSAEDALVESQRHSQLMLAASSL